MNRMQPVFMQHLGFDALNPEVPKRADQTGVLVKGAAEEIDFQKGVVLARFRGRRTNGKYLDWKELVPIDSLTSLPQKAPGYYGKKNGAGVFKGAKNKDRKTGPNGLAPPHVEMERTPTYWRDGKASVLGHYGDYGTHWSDSDGIMHEVGHLPQYWGIALNGKKAKVGRVEWMEWMNG
jgi:hypothetical protein